MNEKYNPKTQLKVLGEMTPKAANIAGIILASAALTAAILLGIASVIFAVGQLI